MVLLNIKGINRQVHLLFKPIRHDNTYNKQFQIFNHKHKFNKSMESINNEKK